MFGQCWMTMQLQSHHHSDWGNENQLTLHVHTAMLGIWISSWQSYFILIWFGQGTVVMFSDVGFSVCAFWYRQQNLILQIWYNFIQQALCSNTRAMVALFHFHSWLCYYESVCRLLICNTIKTKNLSSGRAQKLMKFQLNWATNANQE